MYMFGSAWVYFKIFARFQCILSTSLFGCWPSEDDVWNVDCMPTHKNTHTHKTKRTPSINPIHKNNIIHFGMVSHSPKIVVRFRLFANWKWIGYMGSESKSRTFGQSFFLHHICTYCFHWNRFKSYIFQCAQRIWLVFVKCCESMRLCIA